MFRLASVCTHPHHTHETTRYGSSTKTISCGTLSTAGGADCKGTLAASWFDEDGGDATVYATLGSATSNVETLAIAPTPADDGELSAAGVVVALPSFSTVGAGSFDVPIFAHTGSGSAEFALGVWVAQVDDLEQLRADE